MPGDPLVADKSVFIPELLADLERLNLEKQKPKVAPGVPPQSAGSSPPMNERIDDAGSGSSVSSRTTRGLKLELEGADHRAPPMWFHPGCTAACSAQAVG